MSVETRAVFYTVLLCVPLAAAMAMWVRWVWRRQAQQREAFGQSLADWGFRQSTDPMVGEFFWLGSWRQRPVVLGFFQGRGAHLEVEVFDPCVMIMVHGGAFPDGEGTVSLTPSERSVARDASLASRIDDLGLQDLGGLGHPMLFYADDLVRGAQLELAIRSHAVPSWPGISMRATLPLACTRPEIEAALDSMTAWLDRL
jgi:hypothetical protein